MEFLILVWVGCMVAGGAITNSKNRGWGVGIAWGFFLGVIGLIGAACMRPASLVPPGMEAATCPRCNAVQNIPRGDSSFECWRCHYLARSHAGKKAINE
jgi:hypothetical protein